MKTRIIAGCVFGVVMALTFFIAPTWVRAITMALMVALASYELLHATGLVKEVRLNLYSAVMAALVAWWSHGSGSALSLRVGILVYVLVLFAELLLSSGKLSFEKICYCLFSGLIMPFLLTALLRIRNRSFGWVLLFVPFIMAYFSDMGAYFVGVFIGKHKMCPNISPKKTWEGLVGGIVCAVLGMLLYAFILNQNGKHFDYLYAAVFGLIGSLGSVVGDLTMSVIKRQTGIKDYGKLIPGHGGILDRFDSVMVTAPMAEILLILALRSGGIAW